MTTTTTTSEEQKQRKQRWFLSLQQLDSHSIIATTNNHNNNNDNNNRICILSERLIIGKIGMLEDDELGLSSKTVVGMDVCLPQQHSHYSVYRQHIILSMVAENIALTSNI